MGSENVQLTAWKRLPDEFLFRVKEILIKRLEPYMLTNKVCLISKQGDAMSPNSYRPAALQCGEGRAVENVAQKQINSFSHTWLEF